MTSRYRRKPVHIARFLPLESAVLDALAWELRPQAPDLAGQIAKALPGRRRNTGGGFHHEIIVDRRRPSSRETSTGLFGSVHALVDGLEDAVAFQVELHNGRLIALVADAYDQDTRPIDFQTAGFEQVFYLDANGRSRLFEPSHSLAEDRPGARLRSGSRTSETTPPPPLTALQRAASLDPGRRLEDALLALEPVVSDAPTSRGDRRPGALTDIQSSESRTGLGMALWAVLILFAVGAVTLLRVPFIVAAAIVYWVGRALSRPAVLARIGDALEARGLRGRIAP